VDEFSPVLESGMEVVEETTAGAQTPVLQTPPLLGEEEIAKRRLTVPFEEEEEEEQEVKLPPVVSAKESDPDPAVPITSTEGEKPDVPKKEGLV
jgi:hypothetical protein